METLVAAHRTMPFNTWLRVTNIVNQKSVEVRVIDRGPFVGNRIIDLSKAAARQIDLIGPGVGPVKLQVISAPVDITSNDFYAVQIGAFASYDNAERTRLRFASRFGTAQLLLKQGPVPLYRVLVGKVRSTAEANELADQLRPEVSSSLFVVRLDQTQPSLPAPAPPQSAPIPQ
jgi:rare lipoprotein A